jgi:hypothetical protein
MLELGPADEKEVVLAFLKAEVEATRYGRVPHSCVVCKGADFDVPPATLQIFPSTARKN